jgi:hypothetical protein
MKASPTRSGNSHISPKEGEILPTQVEDTYAFGSPHSYGIIYEPLHYV